jgi:hypothetical protein
MFRTPRSFPRSRAVGSTWVSSAKSTALNAPKPMPSATAVTSAPDQVGHTEISTAAPAMTSAPPVTKTRRRPRRSDNVPATTTEASIATE